ncbi:putative permease YjgP/YjgQ family protein [Caulifigura coniformis]|uniref:Putative permease YjgP/YjgQ family protein n=1 Tax=Caulifigura coniformis TaxID=2527983 RepID=A0A517SH54_9PLAN|nr:LptF/LptG family permease [Caulifigura coniformis]QDT55451.1 putative permease YjgP/YjgQ family protein [Caulifigura coniformis]
MPLLQRYILSELTRTFLFVLLCLTLLVNVVGVFQTATERGLAAPQVWEVLPFIVPSMMPFTIPAALLLTVCLVYGRMAGDQEVTAAKAAGVSVMTVLWPSILLGAALSAVCFALTDRVIPWALDQMELRIVQMVEDVFFERLRTDRSFVDRQRGLEITILDIRGKTLISPVICYKRKDGRVQKIYADEATISLDVKRQLAEIHIKYGSINLGDHQRINVTDESFPFSLANEIGKPKPRNLPIEVIDEQVVTAIADEERARERQTVDALLATSWGDFHKLSSLQKWRAKAPGRHSSTYHRLKTEVHSRYAMSCSCLFFVLFGGPFAIYKAKSQFLTSFLYCFVPIVAIYYPLILGIMTQSKKGNINPAWGMWLGNLGLLVASIVILRRVRRH